MIYIVRSTSLPREYLIDGKVSYFTRHHEYSAQNQILFSYFGKIPFSAQS
jgi:hypothetical protein